MQTTGARRTSLDAAALRSAFERDGLLIFDPRIPEDVLDQVNADVARLATGLERLTDGWSVSESVKQIALAPVVLDVLEILYGREAHPFQTLNFQVGTQQKPHSDLVHFNTNPAGAMCGVWVALEDVDMDCGPLVYYPGSHRLPYVSPQDVGMQVQAEGHPVDYANYGAHYEPYIEALIEREGLRAQYGTVRKGQALVWAANLLHGGSAVRVPGRTRRSQVTHYLLEGARLWTPMLSTETDVVWREAPKIGSRPTRPTVRHGLLRSLLRRG